MNLLFHNSALQIVTCVYIVFGIHKELVFKVDNLHFFYVFYKWMKDKEGESSDCS